MEFTPSFEIGATVSNQDICAEFKCSNMGGMRRARATNTLVIISDYTKSIYDDKWYGDTLHYTGMGKVGDQVLDGNQNRTLFESDSNNVSVHLFEVIEATRYIYHGPVSLASTPYQEIQKDSTGNNRKVWIFPVKPAKTLAISKNVIDIYEKDRKTKAQALSIAELKEKAKESSKRKPSARAVTATTYVRDQNIAEYAKRCANGICQLCSSPAPFIDKNGKPYLESHHIVPLAAGGADSIDNTIALCPNCHRKMHVINDLSDVRRLLEKANANAI